MSLFDLTTFIDIFKNVQDLITKYTEKLNNNKSCGVKELEKTLFVLKDMVDIYDECPNNLELLEKLKLEEAEKLDAETKRVLKISKDLLDEKVTQKMKEMQDLILNTDINKENVLKETLNFIADLKNQTTKENEDKLNVIKNKLKLETREKEQVLESKKSMILRIKSESKKTLEREKNELSDFVYDINNLIEKINLKNKIIALKDKKNLFANQSENFKKENCNLQLNLLEKSRLLPDEIVQLFNKQLLIRKDILKCDEESLTLQEKYITLYANLLKIL